MLIDDRTPPLLPPWTPSWQVWRWVLAAVALLFAGLIADGAMATVLILLAFAAGCRAFDVALPYREGLREWRQ